MQITEREGHEFHTLYDEEQNDDRQTNLLQTQQKRKHSFHLRYYYLRCWGHSILDTKLDHKSTAHHALNVKMTHVWRMRH